MIDRSVLTCVRMSVWRFVRSLARSCLLAFALATATLVATAAHAADAMPEPGAIAPDVSLPDPVGKVRTLSEWRGQWLVLYFYPKNETPACTEEACSFRDEWARLQQLGAAVVGVSVDTPASNAAFAQHYKLPFPLLADEHGEAAQRYGALSDWGLVRFAKRRTFIIDPQGRVAKVYQSVDTGRHSGEIIADLQALQAAAAHH